MFPSLMRDFNDDFFSPMDSMRRMESMMDNMMAPFGMFAPMHPQIQNRRASHPSSLMPFGFGSNLFPNMDNMFSFANMGQDPNCHSFSSSSVMTYTTDETGQPQLYQHTASTRTAPGGVKETRETLQDSRSGLQKMAIGHHLHDRAHVIEKKKYKYSGEEEENHEYVNLEDDEVDHFDHEWNRRAQGGFHSRPGPSAVANRAWRDRSPEMLAITDGGQQASGAKKGGMKKEKKKRPHKSHE